MEIIHGKDDRYMLIYNPLYRCSIVSVFHCIGVPLYPVKQSDWLRSISERASFSHPARSEMQPAALVLAPKPKSETILKLKSLPKNFTNNSHKTTMNCIKLKRIHKHDVHQNYWTLFWEKCDENETWHIARKLSAEITVKTSHKYILYPFLSCIFHRYINSGNNKDEVYICV